MRRIIFMCLAVCFFTVSNAQKLKLEQLELLLNASMDKAEEDLFLMGYSSFAEKNIVDSAGVIYDFTNHKKTIGTAKFISKGIYYKEPVKSFIKYTTYDRDEFEAFRKQMIIGEFIREDADRISENSVYSKENLKVTFEVGTDKYENTSFMLILGNIKPPIKEKVTKKLSLKSIIKPREK